MYLARTRIIGKRLTVSVLYKTVNWCWLLGYKSFLTLGKMSFSSHDSAWLVPWLNKVLIIRIILFAYQGNTDSCVFWKTTFSEMPFSQHLFIILLYIALPSITDLKRGYWTFVQFCFFVCKRKRGFALFNLPFQWPKALTLPEMVKIRSISLSNTKPPFERTSFEIW